MVAAGGLEPTNPSGVAVLRTAVFASFTQAAIIYSDPLQESNLEPATYEIAALTT